MRKANWLGKKKILNPGCPAYFNGVTRRASGRIRWPPGGWLAARGPFNFRLARIPGANPRDLKMVRIRWANCHYRSRKPAVFCPASQRLTLSNLVDYRDAAM